MARYDKDKDITIDTPNGQKHIDKPKGAMSIREAASMEMTEPPTEGAMRGKAVHGFGSGTGTSKRHTEMPMHGPQLQPMESSMTPGMQQPSAGESVSRIMDMVFQLPFHAQLSVMRMMAPRVLGAMDARDRENFLRDLRSEIGEEGTATRATDTQDIQGT